MHLHLRSVRAPFRILLLESEGRSRDLHAMILMTHGYDIECTANYIQAWNMWRAKRPDLILVALDIRDMRLFGLLERIRRRDSSQMVRGLRPRLCSVLFDGCIVRGEMAADDILVVAHDGHAGVPRAQAALVQ